MTQEKRAIEYGLGVIRYNWDTGRSWVVLKHSSTTTNLPVPPIGTEFCLYGSDQKKHSPGDQVLFWYYPVTHIDKSVVQFKECRYCWPIELNDIHTILKHPA